MRLNPKINSFLLLFCAVVLIVTACVPAPSAVPTAAPIIEPTLAPTLEPEIPSLYQSLADYFPIGTALMSNLLDDDKQIYFLTRHFNAITPENEMKQTTIQPKEGQFNWSGADRLVQFAQAHQMIVHGHTLVWYYEVPDWMIQDSQGQALTVSPESKALVLERLETHIRALVGRYKGQIAIWDVVNEVIDPSYPDCMRRSKLYELTGTDFIPLAFKVAHEVDPDAKLLINEYDTENPERQACIYNLVRDLRAQGVPVDGIGHQMHIKIQTPPVADVEQTIEKFAELGIEQYITELDMSLYNSDSDSYDVVPQEVLIQQGYRYKELFDVFRRQAGNLKGVSFWGMADDHTWLKTWPVTRLNQPLLFDEQLQPKYAYWGIVDPTYPHLPMLVQKINIAKSTPTIDGTVEPLWDLQSWNALADLPQAGFQARWDEKYLYVIVKIPGDPQNIGKIELFVDENRSRSKTYESDDRHYTFENGFLCKNCEDISAKAAITNDNYQLEVAIPLKLAEGRADHEVGFDLRVVSADLQKTSSWNDHTNQQDTDTSQFGTLFFAPAANLFVTSGTPTIDGEADPVWATASEISTDIWAAGKDGATAKVKLLWDDARLYLFATVTDPNLSDVSRNAYEQDSIEVFIDQNNAKAAAYQKDDGQFRVNFKNVQTYNGNAKASLITSAVKIVPEGYVVELAIQFDTIQPQPGMLIGFDFQVNDDGAGDGIRTSMAKWNDPTNDSYMNTSGFGVLQFVE